MKEQEIIEPEYKRLSDGELDKLKASRVHIYVSGDVAYRLRHLAANLSTFKRLSYSDVVAVLLLSQEIGAPLGHLRNHPKIVEVLGPR